jgi:hypothetical protein
MASSNLSRWLKTSSLKPRRPDRNLAALVVDAVVLDGRGDEAQAGVGGVTPASMRMA